MQSVIHKRNHRVNTLFVGILKETGGLLKGLGQVGSASINVLRRSGDVVKRAVSEAEKDVENTVHHLLWEGYSKN